MSLYAIIFDFFATYLFPPSDVIAVTYEINGTSVAMADWLSHTATIATLVALAIVAALAIRWLFKLVASAFGWLGR